MGWFKRINNNVIRVNAALSFGVDANGDEIVIGSTTQLSRDANFHDGSSSAYGIGSIALNPAGGLHVVDADGLWQTATITAASASASPSGSGSPSHSRSPSASGSPSASVSPSGSASPSHSASPST